MGLGGARMPRHRDCHHHHSNGCAPDIVVLHVIRLKSAAGRQALEIIKELFADSRAK